MLLVWLLDKWKREFSDTDFGIQELSFLLEHTESGKHSIVVVYIPHLTIDQFVSMSCRSQQFNQYQMY